jgi:hypothetical protein
MRKTVQVPETSYLVKRSGLLRIVLRSGLAILLIIVVSIMRMRAMKGMKLNATK